MTQRVRDGARHRQRGDEPLDGPFAARMRPLVHWSRIAGSELGTVLRLQKLDVSGEWVSRTLRYGLRDRASHSALEAIPVRCQEERPPLIAHASLGVGVRVGHPPHVCASGETTSSRVGRVGARRVLTARRSDRLAAFLDNQRETRLVSVESPE